MLGSEFVNFMNDMEKNACDGFKMVVNNFHGILKTVIIKKL